MNAKTRTQRERVFLSQSYFDLVRINVQFDTQSIIYSVLVGNITTCTFNCHINGINNHEHTRLENEREGNRYEKWYM